MICIDWDSGYQPIRVRNHVQIKRFSSEDLPQAVELYNLCHPEHPRSLEYVAYEEETHPTDHFRERFTSLRKG